MAQQLRAFQFLIGGHVPQASLPRHQRAHYIPVVKDSRKDVLLELLRGHFAKARENFLERHFARNGLNRVSKQRPENRKRRDLVCSAIEIGRESIESPLLP